MSYKIQVIKQQDKLWISKFKEINQGTSFNSEFFRLAEVFELELEQFSEKAVEDLEQETVATQSFLVLASCGYWEHLPEAPPIPSPLQKFYLELQTRKSDSKEAEIIGTWQRNGFEPNLLGTTKSSCRLCQSGFD